MSETPRLTRKQLREMGKLAARPEDAPALTDTQELRLRRPSRKELREAERSERERNELLAAKGAAEGFAWQRGEHPQSAGKNESVPTRKSVFDRFESEIPAADSHDAFTARQAAAHLDEMDAAATTSAQHDGFAFKQTEDRSHAAQAAMRNDVEHDFTSATQASQGLESVVKQSADNAAVPAVGIDESNSDSSSQDQEVEFAQGSLRDQLFARMRNSEKVKPEEAEGLSVDDTAVVDANSEISQTDVADVQHGAATVSEQSAAHANNTDMETAGQTQPTPEQSVALSVDAESAAVPQPEASVAVGSAESEEAAAVVVETEIEAESGEASGSAWFIFLILAIIAVLIGYLGGSWINSTFFSAGFNPLDSVIAQGTLLQ